MTLYDWFHIACLAFCVLHSIFEFFRACRLNKKVEKLCQDCGSPVIEGEQHDCVLTSTQLKALTAFVLELQRSKKEN